MVCGKVIFITESVSDIPKDKNYVIELDISIPTLWKAQNIISKANAFRSTETIFKYKDNSKITELFELLRPFAVFEKDREWMLDKEKKG